MGTGNFFCSSEKNQKLVSAFHEAHRATVDINHHRESPYTIAVRFHHKREKYRFYQIIFSIDGNGEIYSVVDSD